MGIITGIDEKWHESLQILLVLSTEFLGRTELCEQVAENQKKIIPDYNRSKSTCRYWINSHLKDGKIRERGSQLELTSLGRWIVGSSVGTMWDRDSFINNYSCWECKPSATVLYKLNPNTVERNKKGDIFMDVLCPRCGNSIKRHKVTRSEFESVKDFLQFYNGAEQELSKLNILH